MDFLNIFAESESEMKVAEFNDKNCPLNDSSSINNNETTQKKKKSTTKKICLIHFSSKNAIFNQTFSFRSTIIQYILKNQSLNVQRKFQKCCKYFFIKNPTLICERMITKNSVIPLRFHHKTVVIGLPYFSVLPKFYSISIEKEFKFELDKNRFALSHLISNNIQKCHAKSVNIQGQNLTLNELKVLIGNENVTELELKNVSIFDNDKNENVQLAEILKLIPNVKILKLTGFEITSFTFMPLENFVFNEKLDHLFIYKISDINFFDPTYLIQFLNKNISRKSEVKIFLQSELLWEEIGEAMVACKTSILNGVNSHFSGGKDKPQLSIDLYYN